jgi:hypothetical protein
LLLRSTLASTASQKSNSRNKPSTVAKAMKRGRTIGRVGFLDYGPVTRASGNLVLETVLPILRYELSSACLPDV